MVKKIQSKWSHQLTDEIVSARSLSCALSPALFNYISRSPLCHCVWHFWACRDEEISAAHTTAGKNEGNNPVFIKPQLLLSPPPTCSFLVTDVRAQLCQISFTAWPTWLSQINTQPLHADASCEFTTRVRGKVKSVKRSSFHRKRGKNRW